MNFKRVIGISIHCTHTVRGVEHVHIHPVRDTFRVGSRMGLDVKGVGLRRTPTKLAILGLRIHEVACIEVRAAIFIVAKTVPVLIHSTKAPTNP